MKNIIAISGSLRRASFNSGLVRASVELAPDSCSIEIESIQDIQLYNADNEVASGVPENVEQLKNKIKAADGLLISTPEYNHSIPGVLKNALDWLTRPPADIANVFHNKPVAIIGASPGGFGTVLSQNAWLPILKTLKVRPFFGSALLVSKARDAFDEDGNLVSDDVKGRLAKFLSGFVEFVE